MRNFLSRNWFRFLAGAGLVVAGWMTVSGAGVLVSELDPVCRLPKLQLRSPEPDSLYELLASDDPAGSSWEKVLQVAPEHDHAWFDPQARAEHRRFYRMQRTSPRPPAAPIWNFRLTDHAGRSHDLLREGTARVVVLAFTDNAGLKATAEALRPIRERFADKPVRFWLVNPVDPRPSLAPAVATASVEEPVLHDIAQSVTRTFGVGRVGEVVAVTGEMMEELYRGAVADRVELNGVDVRQDYLADAVASYLEGRPVRVPFTRAPGVSLALGEEMKVEYARDVAPILIRSCVPCHREGDVGSFAMTSHRVLAEKIPVMKANLLEGLMPPWHADAPKGVFANDFALEPDETKKLVAWLDAGAPRGEGPDPLELNPTDPPVDWPMGPPDRILSIQTQNIPAKGVQSEIPYRYLLVMNPFPTNVWLRAAVVRPGNRKVVHHALIFTGTGFADLLQVQAGLGGFFAGYVPGMEQVAYPEGTGKLLKAGAFVIFQMHYTPVAAAQTDRTQIGLYLASAPPAKELVTGAAYTTDLNIAPGDIDSPVSASLTFQRPVTIHELSPHMHYRGKSMRFEAELPDGTVETVLNVPYYDFAWQAMYRLVSPRTYPAGTRLVVKGSFDNSIWNPFNPDPASRVGFGEQTNDEMFIGYLNYTLD